MLQATGDSNALIGGDGNDQLKASGNFNTLDGQDGNDSLFIAGGSNNNLLGGIGKRSEAGRHVKQRPVTFDGESLTSGLNGASHPIGIPVRVAGATKSSRSPLRDRSTMPSCVIDLD